MKGFINAKVYVEGKGIITACVGVKDGKIEYIGNDASLITEPYEFSLGQVVVPGFIDEHIHGAAGADAMDGTKDALSKIANAIASEGTTSFLAHCQQVTDGHIIDRLFSPFDFVVGEVAKNLIINASDLPFVQGNANQQSNDTLCG